MDLLVALWTRDVSSADHGLTGLNGQLDAIEKAAAAVTERIGHHGIPGGQAICGILVCPEYFISTPRHGEFDIGTGGFRNRSVSQTDKRTAITKLQEISTNNPKVLMVPGTIAWTKSFDRGGVLLDRNGQPKAFSRLEKAQQHIVTAHGLGLTNLNQRQEIAPGAALDVVLAFRSYALADATHRAAFTTIYAALPTPLTGDSLTDACEKLLRDDTRAADFLTHIGLGVTPAQFRDQIKRTRPSETGKTTFLQTVETGNPAAYKLMRNTAVVLLGGVVHHKYHKVGDFFEVMNDHADTVFIPGNRASDVEIATIRFGFEICLDHNLGTLQKRVTLQRRPDIHVVCSDTVTNNPAHIFARPGGLYLHASSVGKNTAIYKVGLDGTKTALVTTDPEFLENHDVPGVGGSDKALQLWKLSLQGRPRYDTQGRTLADVLIATATTWEAGASGFLRRPSDNSRAVATWLKANARNQTEEKLRDLCKWLFHQTNAKPAAFAAQTFTQLSNNGKLFTAIRTAYNTWDGAAL